MATRTKVPEVFRKLGVMPIIHGAGTTTRYGGSLMRPETIEAMKEASRALVNIDELNEAAGEAIARRREARMDRERRDRAERRKSLQGILQVRYGNTIASLERQRDATEDETRQVDLQRKIDALNAEMMNTPQFKEWEALSQEVPRPDARAARRGAEAAAEAGAGTGGRAAADRGPRGAVNRRTLTVRALQAAAIVNRLQEQGTAISGPTTTSKTEAALRVFPHIGVGARILDATTRRSLEGRLAKLMDGLTENQVAVARQHLEMLNAQTNT